MLYLDCMNNQIKILTLLLMLSLTQCKDNCTKVERCSLEPDAGMCMAAIPRYYYDTVEKKCKVFTWGGCTGVVPFETLQECENGCYCF